MSDPRRSGTTPQQPAQGRAVPPTPPAGARPGQPAGGHRQGASWDPAATQVRPGQVPSPARVPATGQRQPVDVATRLEGQRGWLNELDQKLKKRSLIALILTCIAIGAGAAAIYISLSKNSDGDRIDALETRISALETAAGVGTSTTDPSTTDPSTTTPGTTDPYGTTTPSTTDPATGTTPDTGTTTPGLELPGG